MEASISIAGGDYIAEYSYRITAEAVPEQGPSYSSGGEPASPMEFEVDFESLRPDPSEKSASLVTPDWLKRQIEETLVERDDVYDAVCADANDTDDYADYRHDIMNDG